MTTSSPGEVPPDGPGRALWAISGGSSARLAWPPGLAEVIAERAVNQAKAAGPIPITPLAVSSRVGVVDEFQYWRPIKVADNEIQLVLVLSVDAFHMHGLVHENFLKQMLNLKWHKHFDNLTYGYGGDPGTMRDLHPDLFKLPHTEENGCIDFCTGPSLSGMIVGGVGWQKKVRERVMLVAVAAMMLMSPKSQEHYNEVEDTIRRYVDEAEKSMFFSYLSMIKQRRIPALV